MDYVDRMQARLERNLDADLRRYHHALSRVRRFRERLAATPLTRPDEMRPVAVMLSRAIEDAARLRSDVAVRRRALAAFDAAAQREANRDVDGTCRYLDGHGVRCGCPAVEGSRWCRAHVDHWLVRDWGDGLCGHEVGVWRFLCLDRDTSGKAHAVKGALMPVDETLLHAVVEASRGNLSVPHLNDGDCTVEEECLWTTLP